MILGVFVLRPVPLADHQPPGADRIDAAIRAAFAAGELELGHRIVAVAGHPVEGGPRLPTLRVVQVGEGGVSMAPA